VTEVERRLELVADAEHELRAAITAFALGLEGNPLRAELESELERARAALADLTAVREGTAPAAAAAPADVERLARSAAAAWGRAGAVEVDWQAGAPRIAADRGRVAQVIGNLLANAVEHGAGAVRLIARRRGGAVRLEVVNARHARGRGLRIAARAARLCGGELTVGESPDRVAAALDLPLAR
jgi:two-component system sensor histidine kinase MtrB